MREMRRCVGAEAATRTRACFLFVFLQGVTGRSKRATPYRCVARNLVPGARHRRFGLIGAVRPWTIVAHSTASASGIASVPQKGAVCLATPSTAKESLLST
jgi:hypothetical protein